ncbi:D-alanyl-D-alanine carboxypeptidase [Streptomyces tubbatahanensis]|uniref:D-alanyl-D-alanine carboxypeptidase n=1 Tax=Streptomyces tubbatahanensis TaxID=2923272 RepID=A0ABY3XSY3_9ACTN|nr:serine hydrolase [Streptomyces tubbatahanensis]UNS97517.1 D-alanyl-D-alanine carboxypeptidase [Streptomyces tubbatahanensis]
MSSSGAAKGAGVAAEDSTADAQSGGASSKIPAPTTPDEEAPTTDGATEGHEGEGPGGTDGVDGQDDGKGRDGRDSGESRDAQGERAGTGDEGDERLKSAVAAWVAGDSSQPEGSDGSDGAHSSEAAGGRQESGQANDGGAGDRAAASDLPVRPKAAEADKTADKTPAKQGAAGEDAGSKKSSDAPGQSDGGGRPDAPTAMFGVLHRDDVNAAKDSDTAAADRAERLTSAFFGASKRAKEDGDAEGGEEAANGAEGVQADGGTKPANGDAKPADGAEGGRAAKPAVDQPTAIFRAPDVERAGSRKSGQEEANGNPRQQERSGQSGQSGQSGTSEKGEKSAQSGGSGRKGSAAPEAHAGAADPRASDPRKPATTDAATGAQAATASSTAAREAGKQATAARDAGKQATATGTQGTSTSTGAQGTAKTSSGGPSSDKSTADKSTTGKAATGAPDRSAEDGRTGGESDAERTSQFIPLRSTDGPRMPAKPLPPAASSSAAPTAPRKPSSPPSGAPTANPWSSAPQRPAEAPRAPHAPGGAGTPSAAESEPERTRQQPMPGTPEAEAAGQQNQQPLDLLAQLTNTPPPPETPLRTAARRVKIWTPLVLLLAVVFVVVQSVRAVPDPELSLTASRTYTFEGSKPSMPWPSEGQAVIDVQGLGSFGSYGEQKPVPIASVAKVMTAYVILRDHPVKKGSKGAMIPVDKKAEKEAGLSAQNESTVEVDAGEKISQREALNAIMIASANNVARLLGRWDAGSEKAFVKKMNAAAKDLGMTNSHYTDPSGLTASTVSTAADQVKLAKKVMQYPIFREVVRQPLYVDGNGKTQRNWNRLVPMDGVRGIKTGTTTKAGGNLVFAAEKEIGGTKQLIIGAMLGQYKPSILDTVLASSKKLIDAAQDSLTSRTVVKKGEVVGYVDDQLGGKTPVVATEDVKAVGWSGLKVELGLTDGGKTIPHEAEAGTKVGTLTAGDGPGQVKVPVALQDDLSEPGFGDKLTRVG